MREFFPLCGHFFCNETCTFSTEAPAITRVSSKDTFELRYLRWDYMVGAENPPDSYLHSVERIIEYMARQHFGRISRMLRSQSMDIDDLKNILRSLCIGFWGKYSIQGNEVARQRMLKSMEGKNYTEADLIKKDNYKLMAFLKQRIQEFRSIFSSKNKSDPAQEGLTMYRISKRQFEKKLCQIPIDPVIEGWEKVPVELYKEIIPKFKDGEVLDFGGYIYYSHLVDCLVYGLEEFDKLESTYLNPEDQFQEDETFVVMGDGSDEALDGLCKRLRYTRNKRKLLKAVAEKPEQYGINKAIVDRVLAEMKGRSAWQN